LSFPSISAPRYRTLCCCCVSAGFPGILAGPLDDFRLLNGTTAAQKHSDLLHIPSDDSRKIQIVADKISSHLRNISVDSSSAAAAAVLSTEISLPSEDEFNAELTTRLHAQAAAAAAAAAAATPAAAAGKTEEVDSWVAERRSAADIEMALVTSAQTVISRQHSAAEVSSTKPERKATLQRIATQTASLFELLGPAYASDDHRWANTFGKYVRHPQVRLS
jgi:hypothetical protein